jgi:hypothetical protein
MHTRITTGNLRDHPFGFAREKLKRNRNFIREANHGRDPDFIGLMQAEALYLIAIET